MTLLATASTPRSAVSADARVLATRRLHPTIRLDETAVFGDDIWPLTPALHRVDRKSLRLDFTTLPAPFIEAAKELCFALLTGDVPAGESLVGIETIRKTFGSFRRFLIWADGRVDRLEHLTANDLVDYHADLVQSPLSNQEKAFQRRACSLFWLYRGKLSADRLALDPRQLEQWQAWGRAHARTPTPTENRTPRIAEPVMAPLLGWALRWIDDFADDVLAARDEYLDVRFRRVATDTPALDALTELLDQYRRERRPLPAARPQDRSGRRAARGERANIDYLAKRIGRTGGNLDSRAVRALIDDAVGDVGLDTDSHLHIRPAGELDGRPWLDAISYYDAENLEQHLQTACWIVVAYLSGMRDSEVKHLQRGCLTVQRDPTGRIYRRRLHSLAFKGEHDPRGVPATWMVGAPVERAIAVLERLQPPQQHYLFSLNPCSSHKSRNRDPDRAISSNNTISRLRNFVAWINDYCRRHQRPDRIPDVQGQPPKLTTRQFRRTLAWFIARRPGGAIAGAIQYRHQQIQMFEGYAGSSASGFRDEVEAEEALARGEFLADMGLAVEHARLTGPAATEAEQRLTEFARHATFEGQVVVDEARLRRVLARHDPHVYPGVFVTCAYIADRALCRRAGSSHPRPAMADCQPLACRNVALTAVNRHALTDHLAQLEQVLTGPDRLAPYQRHRLHQQREEIAEFLSQHADRTAAT